MRKNYQIVFIEFIVAFVLAFVCALVFWIFDHQLKLLSGKAVNYWSSINKKYSDKLFLDLARKYRHDYNMINSRILDFWNSIGLIGFCILFWLSDLSPGRINVSPVSLAIDDTISKVETHVNIRMILTISITIGTLIILLNNSLKLGRARKINAYLDVFEQEMCGLRPFIGEQMTIELQSKWALMKNEEDWEVINKEIESLKTNHGLKFC